jgi:hypothetical protein
VDRKPPKRTRKDLKGERLPETTKGSIVLNKRQQLIIQNLMIEKSEFLMRYPASGTQKTSEIQKHRQISSLINLLKEKATKAPVRFVIDVDNICALDNICTLS